MTTARESRRFYTLTVWERRTVSAWTVTDTPDCKDFVDAAFARYKDQFGLKRTSGARAMRYGDWNGLCTMRDLRQAVIVVPPVT